MRALLVLLALSAPALAAPKDTVVYLYLDSDSDVQADITLNGVTVSPGTKLHRTAQHMEVLRPDRLGDANRLCVVSGFPATMGVTVAIAHKNEVAKSDSGAVALTGGIKHGDDTSLRTGGGKPACVDFALRGYGTPAAGSKEPVSVTELRDYGTKLIGLVKSKATARLVAEWQLALDGMVGSGMGTADDGKAELDRAFGELEKGPLVAVAPADIHGLKVGPGERYAIVVGTSNGPLLATEHMAMTPIVEKRNGTLRIVESR